MDAAKLFNALEDVVYEVASWVVLLPKTLLQVVRHPAWSNRYLGKELEKKPENRYDDFMSPVLFWLLTAALPLIMFRIAYHSQSGSSAPGFADQLTEAAFFLMSLPLAMAAGAEHALGAVITRKRLRIQFGIQCYVFGVAYLLLTTGLVLNQLTGNPLGDWVFLPSLLWIGFAEFVILRAQLGDWKRMAQAIFVGLMAWAFLFILFMAIATPGPV